jgi:maltokinase
MLRSFDYASRYLLLNEPEDPQLEYRAAEWADRNRDAFCDGYTEVSGVDPRDQEALLRAFEADKVVYEAVYETRNRPHWLRIPLAALDRLTPGGG